ncbi:unnamed protein product, partial [Sphenostylis stenocarpa]
MESLLCIGMDEELRGKYNKDSRSLCCPNSILEGVVPLACSPRLWPLSSKRSKVDSSPYMGHPSSQVWVQDAFPPKKRGRLQKI